MAVIPCFLLEESQEFVAFLRVFTFPEEDACPSREKLFRTLEQGHDVLVPVDDAPPPPDLPEHARYGTRTIEADGTYTDEATGERRRWRPLARQWPTHCICGYAFRDHDHRQLHYERRYTHRLTGLQCLLAEAPVGAMWYDDRWGEDPAVRWLGPDGRCLVVKTPGGTCYLDREVDGRKLHPRSGEAPRVTVEQLLTVGRWRGWLRDGELIDD
jgi:hypothetical protein